LFSGKTTLTETLEKKLKATRFYTPPVRIIETTGTFFGEIQWEKNMHKSDLI
jgi:hypothetical protein